MRIREISKYRITSSNDNLTIDAIDKSEAGARYQTKPPDNAIRCRSTGYNRLNRRVEVIAIASDD